MKGELDFAAVTDRLKAVLGEKTDTALAAALGMSPSAFNNRKKAGSVPYEEIVDLAATRDFDLVYVLTGGAAGAVAAAHALEPGAPANAPSTAHLVREPLDADGNYARPPEEFVQIPLYDVRAAAGFGAFIQGEHVSEALAFRRDWIDRQFGAAPRDLRLIYVSGDSMEPALSDGDVIMVDRAQRHVRADGLYVLRFDDALVVKKLQRMPGGVIKIFSENPAYESFTLHSLALESGEDGQVIGRVVWGARKF